MIVGIDSTLRAFLFCNQRGLRVFPPSRVRMGLVVDVHQLPDRRVCVLLRR